MLPSAHTHLNEIAKILARAIDRIEAAKLEANKCNTHNNEELLDFDPHLRISELPYNPNQKGGHSDNAR